MSQFVIAKYNEDVSWTKQFSDKHDIIIYDKSGSQDGCVKLENVGRESHTFLHHIINNYNTLADHTVFLQGNPFPHCCNTDSFNTQGYVPLGNKHHCNKIAAPDHTGLSLELVYDCLKTKANNIPEQICFYAGSQFVVPKNKILYYPKSFYEKAYQMHYEIKDMPWIIERFWDLIWTNQL